MIIIIIIIIIIFKKIKKITIIIIIINTYFKGTLLNNCRSDEWTSIFNSIDLRLRF